MAKMRRSLVALALSLALAAPARGASAELLRPGEAAPLFTLKSLNGERSKVDQVALKSHVGEAPVAPKKLVVLTFGASYCEPCKLELQELEKAKKDLEASGALIWCVAVDTDPEGIRKMGAIAEALGLTIPVLADRFGVIARRYRVDTLPALVAIGSDGLVLGARSGYEPLAAKKLVRDLLGQTRSSSAGRAGRR
ncbi:MAG: TlpA family protein disulfide reductase [Deltaproteobacteria bacterium]|nr:TlpA family protein disulfide reductase [Deltaproteobacteria bacterium]